MFFQDDNFTFIKLNNSFVQALHQSIVQGLVSLNKDGDRESLFVDRRIKSTEFFLLNFLNELNHTEILNKTQGSDLRAAFLKIVQTEEEENDTPEHPSESNQTDPE